MNYHKIITQWLEFEIPSVKPRLIDLNLDYNIINTIIGPRRSGKTYFCYLCINKLLKRNIENILYINFEDEKLLGATADDLNSLLNVYYELSEIKDNKKIYLFLDEIQNVQNWDMWIRRIYDTQKNIHIILTGSSSKLLSSEISTKLRGRTLTTEILPLSFKEVVLWRNLNYDLKNISYSRENIPIKKEFSKYLMDGGYPALVDSDLPKDQVLQDYYEVMILRDIVERHKIKELKKMRILSKLIFESTGSEITYNRLANKMKSLGFSMSKNTLIEYISYFEEAFLFFQNLKYEYSLTKQLGSIKKVYCIDNGFLNAISLVKI